MPERIKTIAVDFDGVVHMYSRGWADGTIYDDPMPGAIDGLRTLMEHYAVFIHTSREIGPVASWLIDQGFVSKVRIDSGETFWNERGLLLVTNRKLPAVAYLDDRAVRFTSWDQALRDLIPDPSYDAAHQRVMDALTKAWPSLADDTAYVEQLAHVALKAANGGDRA